MTESEWWAGRGPAPAIDWLFFDTPAIDRKFRLFSVACCRRVESQIAFQEAREALACAESFADGLVSEPHAIAVPRRTREAHEESAIQEQWGRGLDWAKDKECSAYKAVMSALNDIDELRQPHHRMRSSYPPEHFIYPYPHWCAELAADAAGDYEDEASMCEGREESAQMRLLRDIFGPLPFCDIAADPSWLTTDVLSLARGIYEEKAFDRMPILADALQDAGCDSDEILSHCRAEGWEHVRGCWVIDLLLGRPWRESQ